MLFYRPSIRQRHFALLRYLRWPSGAHHLWSGVCEEANLLVTSTGLRPVMRQSLSLTQNTRIPDFICGCMGKFGVICRTFLR